MVLLASAVAVMHLLPGLDANVAEGGIRNSLHVVGFAAVAAIVFEQAPFRLIANAVVALLFVVALGFIAETVQKISGHAFDIIDIYRDVAGASAYLVARLIWQRSLSPGRRPARRLALRSLSGVCGLAIAAPLAYWSIVLLTARAAAPLILDTDNRWAGYFFHAINASATLVGDDRNRHRTVEVLLGRRPRSGIVVATALFDWSPYEALVFKARILDGESTALSVHINDYEAIGHFVDTEPGCVTVTRDSVEFRIPLRGVRDAGGRSTDLADIRQVVFFARSRRKGARLQIDDIHLE